MVYFCNMSHNACVMYDTGKWPLQLKALPSQMFENVYQKDGSGKNDKSLPEWLKILLLPPKRKRRCMDMTLAISALTKEFNALLHLEMKIL